MLELSKAFARQLLRKNAFLWYALFQKLNKMSGPMHLVCQAAPMGQFTALYKRVFRD